MADNILVLVSLCFCLPRSLVLALCTLRCLHLYAEGGPSLLGMSKIKSATPLTAPSYFIRAPVLASRLPPLGTDKAYEPVWDIVIGTIPNNHVVFGFLIMVLSVFSYSSVE